MTTKKGNRGVVSDVLVPLAGVSMMKTLVCFHFLGTYYEKVEG